MCGVLVFACVRGAGVCMCAGCWCLHVCGVLVFACVRGAGVCMCACMYMHRIVSMDKTLRIIYTSIIIVYLTLSQQKTTNRSGRFEILKPFPFVFSLAHEDVHENAQYSIKSRFVRLGQENILFAGLPAYFSTWKSDWLGQ